MKENKPYLYKFQYYLIFNIDFHKFKYMMLINMILKK